MIRCCPLRVLGSLFVGGVLLAALACGPSQPQAALCSREHLQGNWRLAMADPESVQVLTGSVQFTDSSGQTNLVARSREGTGEIIDYPVEILRLQPDSMAFAFAPIRYELRGQCYSPDSLGGDYAVKLFQDTASVRGTWMMTRRR
jgi:hypothetical protein